MKSDIKKLIGKMLNTPVVVETGISGIWTYRKWSDGTAECWGVHSATIAVTSGWGGVYYGAINMPAFPFTFNSRPTVQLTLHTTGGSAWISPNLNNVSASSTGGVYVYSPANLGSLACAVGAYAIGKWK